MPSKLKAGGTFPYVLECDREDDPGSVFHLNILSCAEEEELLDARERYFEASGDKAKQRELTLVMLGIAVKSFDVKGQEGKELKTFLTDRECFELVAASVNGTILSPGERKKFVSPQPSDAAKSADDAQAQSAATE